MKRFLNFIVIMSFLTLSNIFANKPIFQIKPENCDFLRYFYISNLYDSAKVVYKFGEVKLINGTDVNLVNLAHSMDTVEGKRLFGTEDEGISYDLQSLARTENFVIPSADFPKITFVRGISESGHPCNPNLDDPGGGHGEWDILDRTEFVLQLVNANSGEILANIDSVVSLPNNEPESDSIFGTNPHIIFHELPIPPLLLDSTVFIRVSPRRYGPTPLGLIMSEQSLWANYGSLLDSTGNNLGIDNQHYLDSIAWGELRTYLDSMIFVTGNLPFHDYHVPQSRFHEYKQLYFSDFSYRVINGDTIYSKKSYNTDFYPEYKNTIYEMNDKTRKVLLKLTKIHHNRDSLFLEITSLKNTRIKINLRNKSNYDKINIWNGAIVEGDNKIIIDIQNLASGKYSVVLNDINNHHVIMRCEYDVVK